MAIVGYDESDANPANHYWVVLNSWGTASLRPRGVFRMPMVMNYSGKLANCSWEYLYWFETLDVQIDNACILSGGAKALFTGDTCTFTAKVTGSSSSQFQWSALHGTVQDGIYTAPATPCTDTITAKCVSDPGISGTATLTVRGTDFDGNTAAHPSLLNLAGAMGSQDATILATYDFDGDGTVDDNDLALLFAKMGW